MPISLAGVLPACVLPFADNGSIDIPEYRRHLTDLTSTPGVTGVVCNGHAGEVTSLTRDEWQLTVATTVETVNGAAHVITGIYAETHRDVAELAGVAAAEGADAALV